VCVGAGHSATTNQSMVAPPNEPERGPIQHHGLEITILSLPFPTHHALQLDCRLDLRTETSRPHLTIFLLHTGKRRQPNGCESSHSQKKTRCVVLGELAATASNMFMPSPNEH
jgi:hypothetical protein